MGKVVLARGNNPIRYVDPDGREILIHGDESTQNKILDMINNLSKDQYKVYNGSLEKNQNETNKNGSQQYSDAINSLIKKGTTSIHMGDMYFDMNTSTEKNTPGGYTQVNANSTIAIINVTGKDVQALNPDLTNDIITTAAFVLMHEIAGHAAPQLTGTVGNAIEIENSIRSELNKNMNLIQSFFFTIPLRTPDENHGTHKYK